MVMSCRAGSHLSSCCPPYHLTQPTTNPWRRARMDNTEEYEDKLRTVFDLCDGDAQGYITVQHFLGLAREHFGAAGNQEIVDTIQVLDQTGDGKIYFHEFCRGVKQILELNVTSSPYQSDSDSGVTLQTIGSEETLVAIEDDANSCGTQEASEVSTFNEYDMMTDDDQVPSTQTDLLTNPLDNIPQLNLPRPLLGSEDDGDSAISGKSSEFQDQRHDLEVTDEEERFEDFGEVEELESESDSHNTSIFGHRRNGSSGVSESNRKRYRERRDRDWLRPRRSSNGSGRRVTTSSLATHLFRTTGSSAGNSRRSSCSEEIFDDIDGNFMELNDKVKHLESQIQKLSDGNRTNDERHLRMREENSYLVERVHILEEQLRDVELRSQERLEDEERKHREAMSRTDKDKSGEIELLTASLQHIEREYQALKEEAPRLRAEVDRLRRENVRLEEKVGELQCNLVGLSEEHEDLQERTQGQRSEMDQEREVNAQLLDELSKELEELRNYKLEAEGRGRIPTLANGEPKTPKRELEALVVKLKDENAHLREANEDLQAQLLNNHLEEGRSLLQNGTSLASELETLPRDELMKALQEQRDANAKLREYLDRLMLRIIEKNPALLEVTEKPPPAKSKRGLFKKK